MPTCSLHVPLTLHIFWIGIQARPLGRACMPSFHINIWLLPPSLELDWKLDTYNYYFDISLRDSLRFAIYTFYDSGFWMRVFFSGVGRLRLFPSQFQRILNVVCDCNNIRLIRPHRCRRPFKNQPIANKIGTRKQAITLCFLTDSYSHEFHNFPPRKIKCRFLFTNASRLISVKTKPSNPFKSK